MLFKQYIGWYFNCLLKKLDVCFHLYLVTACTQCWVGGLLRGSGKHLLGLTSFHRWDDIQGIKEPGNLYKSYKGCFLKQHAFCLGWRMYGLEHEGIPPLFQARVKAALVARLVLIFHLSESICILDKAYFYILHIISLQLTNLFWFSLLNWYLSSSTTALALV